MSMTIASTADANADISALLAVIADPAAATAALAKIKAEQEALAALKVEVFEQEKALRESREAYGASVAEAHAAQRDLVAQKVGHDRRLVVLAEQKAAIAVAKAERVEHERQLAVRERAVKAHDDENIRWASLLEQRQAAVAEREKAVDAAAKRLTDAIAATRL